MEVGEHTLLVSEDSSPEIDQIKSEVAQHEHTLSNPDLTTWRPSANRSDPAFASYRTVTTALSGKAQAPNQDPVLIPSLNFIDSYAFQTVIHAAIILNMVEIAAATDYRELECWAFFDNLFLIIFTIEICLNLAHKGHYFFIGKGRWWHVLDFVIVALGALDLWVAPFQPAIAKSQGSSHCLRLLRSLRLLRVLRMFPKLLDFTNALINMFTTVVWIFSVQLLVILVCAIILTQTLNHGEPRDLDPDSHVPKGTQDLVHLFKDVPSAMFSLFRVTTQDNWNEVAVPVVDVNPMMQLFFVFFIIFASWTMISVLTAVASDTMIEATTDRKDVERSEQQRKQRAFLEFLKKCFKQADIDGNDMLDKQEFETLIKRPEVRRQMLESGVKMHEEEMYKAWELLDVDGSGELTIDAFVTGLSCLQEALNVRHVVSIDYSVKRTAARLERCMKNLLVELESVQEQNDQIIQSLSRQEEADKQLQLMLWLWKQWAAKNAPSAVPLDIEQGPHIECDLDRRHQDSCNS